MHKKINIVAFFLGFMFALFLVCGASFMMRNDFSLLLCDYKHVIVSIVVFILLAGLLIKVIGWLFVVLDVRVKAQSRTYKGVLRVFDEHPFVVSVIVMIVCWLPYIIAFYPAIFNPDSSYQIMQFFGIPNKYSTYSILIDKSVIITNHHPVIHTMLLGTALKLGEVIGNDNFGIFLYSLLQIAILSSTLAYTVVYMGKIGVRMSYRVTSLVIYSLVPVFPFYAMTAVKDVIFGSLVILYTIALNRIIESDEIKVSGIVKLIILILLMCLFRNNGVYVLVLSFPWLFIKRKKGILRLAIVFVASLSLFVFYDKVVLSACKITQVSVREALSIPFQQTARLAKEHDKDIEEDDKKIINKLLTYDTLAKRYNPELSDPVKNEFNRYYTGTDLKNYFRVWFRYLFKYPDTYIKATVNNTYGYFCPLKSSWYHYYKYNNKIAKKGFDYHYNSMENLRTAMINIAATYQILPVAGLVVNIGFNTWLIFIMAGYLLYRKKYSKIIVLAPALILILVCIASAANTYFRYALPYVFSMPVLIAIFLFNSDNREKDILEV